MKGHTQRKGNLGRSSICYFTSVMMAIAPLTPALALDPGALPEGGHVTHGNASIDYGSNRVDIHQTSNRAVLEWQSFDIGRDATTEFHQPSSTSTALNRVTGSQDPSKIFGTLKSNGRVVLLNPNGMIFGRDSQVDVGGLVASTGEIDNNAFMAGDDQLSIEDINRFNASIVNEGSITVSEGGIAALVAPTVRNSGVITAKLGKVSLASGERATLDFYGDDLIHIAADDGFQDALLENDGVIQAEGGTVHMTVPKATTALDNVINMDGVIEASSATKKGGTIILGGGNITVSGSLKADGKTGGGTVKVGGDYQGKGDTTTAKNTTITETAELTANATDNGDGGEVIVWADESTSYSGYIEAKGGANGGDGGFVETSGKINLGVYSLVDTSAALGEDGTWLLDPSNVYITRPGANNATTGNNTPSSDSYYIDADSIQTALGSNNVTILTTNATGSEAGNIYVDATLTWSNGRVLQLQADNDININAAVTYNSGRLRLYANGAINVNDTLTGRYTNFQADTGFNINADIVGKNNAQVTFAARSGAATSIGVGDGVTGDLVVSATELAYIKGSLNNNGGIQFNANGFIDTIEVGSGISNIVGGYNFDTISSGSITFNNDVDFSGAGKQVRITTGDLTIDGALTLPATRFDVTADSVDVNAAFSGSTANLIIHNNAVGTMGVGSTAAGDLLLDDTSVSNIWTSTPTNLVLGDMGFTTDLEVDSAINWSGQATFRALNSLTIDGDQNFNNKKTTFTTNNLTLNGAMTGVGNNSDITTDTIQINNDFTSGSASVILYVSLDTAGETMGLGTAQAGTFQLSYTELDYITGFKSIYWGGNNLSYNLASTINVGARDWTTNTVNNSSGIVRFVAETVNVNGLQQFGNNSVNMFTNDMNMTGALLQSNNNFLYKAASNTDSRDIGLGDGAVGDTIFTSTDISNLEAGGFDSLAFGNAYNSGTANIDVQDSTWTTALSLYAASDASITTAGDIDASNNAINLAAGNISIGGNINHGSGSLTLTTDDLNISGSVLGSGGILTLYGLTHLGLGDGANANGGLSISRAEFNALQSSFDTVNIYGNNSGNTNGITDLGLVDWTQDTYNIRAYNLSTSAAQDFGAATVRLRDIVDVDIGHTLTGTGDFSIDTVYSSRTISLGDMASGGVEFSDAELDFISNSFNSITFGAYQTNEINLGKTTAWNYDAVFESDYGTSTINVVSDQDFGAYDMELYANQLNLNNNLTGTGTINIYPLANQTIGLGDGAAGTLTLDSAALSRIDGTFTEVLFGARGNSNSIELTDNIWGFNVGFLTWTGGSDITVDGTQDFGGYNANFYSRNINLNNTLSGTGNISFQGVVANDDVSFGDNGGNYNLLDDTEIALIQDGFNQITLGGEYAKSVTLDMNSTWDIDASLYLTAASSNVNVNSAIDVGSNDIILEGDEIEIAANIAGLGSIQLVTQDKARNIQIGSGSTYSLDLSTTELAYLQDGFSNILIGGNDNNGEIWVNEDVTFLDTVTLQSVSGGTGGGIIVNANLANTGADSNIFLYGYADGSSTFANTGIYINDNIDAAGSLTMEADSSAIQVTASNTIEAGGNMSFESSDIVIDSTAAIQSSGVDTATLTFLEYGEDDGIEIGTTGEYTYQLSATELDTIQDGFADIVIGSTAHQGGISINDAITLSDNTSFLRTLTPATGTGRIAVNANVTTTDNADLTLRGAYASGANADVGVDVQANLNAARDLTIESADDFVTGSGTTLTAGRDVTIDANNTVTIDSDVTAGRDITISKNNSDALTIAANRTLDAGNDILLTAGNAGGSSTLQMNTGSALEADGDITLRAAGDIALTGATLTTVTGGDITLNSDKNAAGSGAIAMNATSITTNDGNFVAGGGADPSTGYAIGSNGATQSGVLIENGSSINTAQGDIAILGEARTGFDGSGIELVDSQLITTTGDIALTGRTSTGSLALASAGVEINGSDIQTTRGAVTVDGTVRSNGDDRYGVWMYNDSTITSSATSGTIGDINVNGQFTSNTGGDRYGVYMDGANTSIDSADAIVSLVGASSGSTGNNHGILLQNSATIDLDGSNNALATIDLQGTASAGGNSHGIYVQAGNISSGVRDITLTGTGGTSADTNHGIAIEGNATIESLTNGNIDLTGYAGNGASSRDIYLSNTGGNATIGHANMLGDINVNIDNYGADAGHNYVTQGDIYINPRTANQNIGIGSGSGTFTLSATAFSQFNGSNVYVGPNTATGNVDIDTVSMAGNSSNIVIYGSTFTIADLTTGGSLETYGANHTISEMHLGTTYTSTGQSYNITNSSTGGNTDITGTTLTATNLDVGGTLDLTGTGTMTLTNLDAGGTTTLAGGDFTIDTLDVTAGGLGITGSTMDLTDLTVTGNTDITGTNFTATNLDTSGTLDLTGTGTMTLTNLDAGGTTTLAGGDFTIDTLDVTAGGLNITGTALDLTDLTVTGNTTATGTSLLLNELNSTGSIDLRASVGNITIQSGSVTSGAAGDSILMVANYAFINESEMAGGALDPSTGRFLVYAQYYEESDTGGISGTEIFNEDITSLPPGDILSANNHFIYLSDAPPSLGVDINVPQYISELLDESSSQEDVAVEELASVEQITTKSCLIIDGDSGICVVY